MIRTERLALIPSVPRLVDAEVCDRPSLARLIGAVVPEDWPPESMADALPWFHEQIHRHPDAVGWFHWYALATLSAAPSPVLVASIGFVGPPGEDGTVEIGYSVLPRYQRLGIAREMIAALVRWAFSHDRVSRIVAETTPENVPSVRVLEAAGFLQSGPGREPGFQQFTRESDLHTPPDAPAEPRNGTSRGASRL